MIISTIPPIMGQMNMYKPSPEQRDSPKPPYPPTVVPTNRRAPPLHGGHYMQICCMWNLKHDISSQKFYEILIKTELKGDTALDLKNL